MALPDILNDRLLSSLLRLKLGAIDSARGKESAHSTETA